IPEAPEMGAEVLGTVAEAPETVPQVSGIVAEDLEIIPEVLEIAAGVPRIVGDDLGTVADLPGIVDEVVWRLLVRRGIAFGGKISRRGVRFIPVEFPILPSIGCGAGGMLAGVKDSTAIQHVPARSA